MIKKSIFVVKRFINFSNGKDYQHYFFQVVKNAAGEYKFKHIHIPIEYKEAKWWLEKQLLEQTKKPHKVIFKYIKPINDGGMMKPEDVIKSVEEREITIIKKGKKDGK